MIVLLFYHFVKKTQNILIKFLKKDEEANKDCV